MRKLFVLVAVGLLLMMTDALAAPKVVVTIKPIHSLVAGVMQGVGTPELLLQGAASPHGYSLRPSDVRSLSRADLIVWVGRDLETFMLKPLAAHGRRARVLTLLDAPGMKLLPARSGGAWESDDHQHHGHGGVHHLHPKTDAGEVMDAHLWLSPVNAAIIVRRVAAALAELHPQGAAAYRANEQRLLRRIQQLEKELALQLKPVQGVPYLVFHDAYQYFEETFGLNAVGSITVDPERRPGARRLREIRTKVRELGVAAVFAEPQFEPRLVATVVEGSKARVGLLDPLGADLPPGEEAWFQLMRHMADNLGGTLVPR